MKTPLLTTPANASRTRRPAAPSARPTRLARLSSVLSVTTLACLTLLGLLASAPAARAQSTAIGYQGRLNDAGAPANGSYDFIFTIHDAAADGLLVAGPVRHDAVEVRQGVFSVALDFGPGIFEGADRWLEIQVAPAGGANPVTLSPRTPLLPVPAALYATRAGSVVNGTLTADQLNTGGIPPAPGQLLTYDGAGFSWVDPVTSNPGDGIWSRNGTAAYYNGGSVGIGTASPTARLTLRTSGSFGGYGLEHTDGTTRLATFLDAGFGAWFGTRTAHPLNLFVNDGNPSVTVNLGGSTTFSPNGGYGPMTLGTPNGESGLTIRNGNRADVRFDGTTLKLVAGPGGGPPASFNGLAIHTSGFAGLGTVTPETQLHVEAPDAAELLVRARSERAIVSLDSTIAGQRRVWTLENGLLGNPGLFGIFDRTAGRARLTIDPDGVVAVDALRIRGGADLSEQFDIRPARHPLAPDTQDSPDTNAIEPGMVASIDPENPGRLVIAAAPYDRRVAGVISGAGGVKPGMQMSQVGSVADGTHPVALTGRVYCQVDASIHPIEPGDLLTTSPTPGHAMKAVDPAHAQGAILGKAMGSLRSGRGLVLILVTLQ